MVYVLSIHLALMDILFFLSLSGLNEEQTLNGIRILAHECTKCLL